MKVFSLKTQQRLLLGGLLSMGLLGLGTLLFTVNRPSSLKRNVSSSIKTGVQSLDPQSVWVHQMGYALQQTEKRLDTLERKLQEKSKQEEIAVSQTIKPGSNPAAQLREALAKQLNQPLIETRDQPPFEALAENIANTQTKVPKKTPLSTESKSSSPLLSPPPTQLVPTAKSVSPPHGITHLKLAILPKAPSKTPTNSLLANTFAPAVLLGSVDALTNTQAASDPKPVLLQITGAGHLPQRGKQDLAGCMVSARAYGELPTERVEMRLETLTCRHPKTGSGMEMSVKGYVSGEDGRPGLRGILIDRAGPAIRHVGMAGLLNSFAQFFVNQAHIMPMTSSVSNLNWAQAEGLLKAGAGQGVGNAFEKLADFFIKRAERLEPVIQIQAGRRVTVVFTQGTPFEDQHSPSPHYPATPIKQAELPDPLPFMREDPA